MLTFSMMLKNNLEYIINFLLNTFIHVFSYRVEIITFWGKKPMFVFFEYFLLLFCHNPLIFEVKTI